MGSLRGIGFAAVLSFVLVAGSLGSAIGFVKSDAWAKNSVSALYQTAANRGLIAPVAEIVEIATTPARTAPSELTGSTKSIVAAPQIIRAPFWKSSPMSGPIKGTPLANFGVVEEGIVYRAAQPSESDYEWLLSRGFKSIVNLRGEQDDDREYLLKLGFRNQLWLDIEDETAPTDEQAVLFLNFVTDPSNWPVLIHCKVGLGRTGTMAALIRYSIDGWPMEEALKEARIYRGGISLVKEQVDWLNLWAAKHPPGSYRPVLPDSPILGRQFDAARAD